MPVLLLITNAAAVGEKKKIKVCEVELIKSRMLQCYVVVMLTGFVTTGFPSSNFGLHCQAIKNKNRNHSINKLAKESGI